MQRGSRFDSILIDGSHLFDYVLVDFFYADKLLKNGGYVMFDDTWMPSIKKVLTFVMLNRRYTLMPAEGATFGKLAKVRRMIEGRCFKIKGLYCVVRKVSDCWNPR